MRLFGTLFINFDRVWSMATIFFSTETVLGGSVNAVLSLNHYFLLVHQTPLNNLFLFDMGCFAFSSFRQGEFLCS